MPALDHLSKPQFPRSAAYDPRWLVDLDMGPHPLWLLEDLAADLDLRPGMRVLDLGSGLGATSVFLAREYGVRVVAADLWVDPTESGEVFRRAGVDDLVLPMRVDAHSLPFGRASFDVIVSIDAWEYFGTGDHYPPYAAGFLRPGGQLGVATPALTSEVRDLGEIPEHIDKVVGAETAAWHTAEWLRSQWEFGRAFQKVTARTQPDGCANWLLWERAVMELKGAMTSPTQQMLEADDGAFVTFALVTGTVA
ncbi:class I SAM-dependent methyltransferase [Intrasporangium sp.]|uniref:SAM-dependent methyltransferase n=1 Tax=Intrasporangium sp. TaxID=1925024 RepID=UPI003221A71F